MVFTKIQASRTHLASSRFVGAENPICSPAAESVVARIVRPLEQKVWSLKWNACHYRAVDLLAPFEKGHLASSHRADVIQGRGPKPHAGDTRAGPSLGSYDIDGRF